MPTIFVGAHDFHGHYTVATPSALFIYNRDASGTRGSILPLAIIVANPLITAGPRNINLDTVKPPFNIYPCVAYDGPSRVINEKVTYSLMHYTNVVY